MLTLKLQTRHEAQATVHREGLRLANLRRRGIFRILRVARGGIEQHRLWRLDSLFSANHVPKAAENI